MIDSIELLQDLNRESKNLFAERQTIMSFGGFLDQLKKSPKSLTRNSAQYIKDCFDHFGTENLLDHGSKVKRWKLFDHGNEKGIPIIGTERVQQEIYQSLTSFVQQGYPNRLIMLHGPNGSAKTSIIESIAWAMQRYSETEEGTVFRFNWIFPADKTAVPRSKGQGGGPIGFGSSANELFDTSSSYALLDEGKIASKIHSEFKENPVYLIPMPQRETWLRNWFAEKDDISPEEVNIPPHLLLSGLSKRNQLIYENLLAAYDGDIAKVLAHVQIDRFFYSRQYRVGIGTVEPQMSVDAIEKQLTVDRNISNMPAVLHNINFHESFGPIIEGNRGILEFSDMLKRPIEAYKYLLTTIEKGTLNLPSSTANLDTVFFATSNEKHLDAFKANPDFASFRSRMDLITAPYLLKVDQELSIYSSDIRAMSHTKPIAPHAIRLLCLWAIMTRLKQPDPEYYKGKHRSLLARLDPYSKARLYNSSTLTHQFKQQEANIFCDLHGEIRGESENIVVYEGRFGASPREIRSILYRAIQHPGHKTLTPMAIFEILETIVKDRTVYDFLQLEPRGKYHQANEFIKIIRKDFLDTFEKEVTNSMTLVEPGQHEDLLSRYIEHVVATVKGEKLYNKNISSYEAPSESLMKEVEKILNITGSIDRHREGLLGRIAAWRIDNPNSDIEITKIFDDFLEVMKAKYYKDRQAHVDDNFKCMMLLDSEIPEGLSKIQIDLANLTFQQLEEKFKYDNISARECLRYYMTEKQNS